MSMSSSARTIRIFAILSLCLVAGNSLYAQGILGRRTLSNLDVNTLKESDLTAPGIGGLDQVEKLRQAEKLRNQMLEAENFQQVRSRLPEAIAKDSNALKNYVKTNIFRDTLIFGSELFKQGSLNFAPNIQLANAPNYVLGSGDELNLTIYGLQEASYELEVLPSGNVVIPYAGVISAAGQTLEAFESKLKQKLMASGYRGISEGNTKISVTVTNVRTVSVTAIGARKPGNYTLPAVATVMHLLYASGGPGELGSYRDISLIRRGKVLKTIDLYEYLIHGHLEDNVVLQEGDVVHIPVYQNRVNMMGEFKRPGLYEVKDEEDLQELITYAGSFSEGAYKGQLIIYSTSETELHITDVKANEFDSYALSAGDVILALPLRNRYENKVSITGAVVRPGNYAWSVGIDFQTLLARAEGLDRSALKTKAVLMRRPDGEPASYVDFNPSSDNLVLQFNDSIFIAQAKDFWPVDSITITGYVNQPRKVAYSPGITLEQALMLAGGVAPNGNGQFVEIGTPLLTEAGEFTGDQQVISATPRFNGEGHLLGPGSTISVRARRNLDASKVVYFSGAVQAPGGYSLVKSGEPLAGVYSRVGGLASDAMPRFGMIVRKNPTTDLATIPLYRKQAYRSPTDSSRLVRYEPVTVVPKDTIAVDFTNAQSIRQLGLEDGDTIYIPRRLNVVYVRGEVKNTGGMAFTQNRSAKYYLKRSGGLTSNARLRDVVVEYANGQSAEVQFLFGVIPVYPRVYSNTTITARAKPERSDSVSPAEWSALSASLASISSITFGIIYLLRP
jgi:protein involved in polysaccharide export with SLBB domain